MKNFRIKIILLAAALGTAGLFFWPKEKAPEIPELEIINEPDEIPEQPKEVVVAVIPAPPEPEVEEPPPQEVVQPAPKPIPKPTPAPTPLTEEERRKIAIDRYYDHMERNFERQLSQLERETDPARRKNLIASLGRYVRIDTLEALDWAMGMENQEEQRAALEAINKNALTGIGARIEMDDYGLPKIRETTILSAAESTGMIQAGDYIAGMVTADGRTVSFRGMTMQQIVTYLRGQPGSNIQLQLERSPEYGSTQPIPFEVPLQRSLIVMGRPSDG